MYHETRLIKVENKITGEKKMKYGKAILHRLKKKTLIFLRFFTKTTRKMKKSRLLRSTLFPIYKGIQLKTFFAYVIISSL